MIVNGKQLASKIGQNLKAKVSAHKHPPHLAIIYAGKNEVIERFIRRKKAYGEAIGVQVTLHSFPEEISEIKLSDGVKKLAEDKGVTGILVQLPLPSHINTEKILESIPYEKDVDVLTKATIERFIKKETGRMPPVAGALQHIFHEYGVSAHDKHIVILGEGKLVGKPIALLLERDSISYITVDENTPNSEEIISSGDIIISGVGKPNLITPDMVKEGVVLVDAGTSELGGKLVGDIDPQCQEKASLYTPVPGGVGPLTVAVVFENLVHLAYADDE